MCAERACCCIWLVSVPGDRSPRGLQKNSQRLAKFDPERWKPEIVVLTKTDVVDEATAREAGAELRQVFAPGVRMIGISAITNSGLRQLKHLLWRTIQQMAADEESEDSESGEHR